MHVASHNFREEEGQGSFLGGKEQFWGQLLTLLCICKITKQIVFAMLGEGLSTKLGADEIASSLPMDMEATSPWLSTIINELGLCN